MMDGDLQRAWTCFRDCLRLAILWMSFGLGEVELRLFGYFVVSILGKRCRVA